MRAALVPLLLLSACAQVPDTGLAEQIKVPDLPETLAEKAKPLPPLTDTSMGGLVVDGTNSDMQYNSVSHQLNSVIDLYNCVKPSTNEKKDITNCL